MRIKTLVGIAGADYTYQRGIEYDVTDEIGSDLVRAGHAVEVKVEERAKIEVSEKAKARREGNKGR